MPTSPETAPNLRINKNQLLIAGSKVADAESEIIMRLFGDTGQVAADREIEEIENQALLDLSDSEWTQYQATAMDNAPAPSLPTVEADSAFFTELADSLGEIDGFTLAAISRIHILLIKLEADETSPHGLVAISLQAAVPKEGEIIPRKYTVASHKELLITQKDVEIINQFIDRILQHFK